MSTTSSDSTLTTPIDPKLVKKALIRFEQIKWDRLSDGTQYGKTKIMFANPETGKTQPLVVRGGICTSYGVSDNKDSKTGEVTGYSVCVVPKAGSDFERANAEIHEACCEYIVANREECSLAAVESLSVAKAFLKNPLAHPNKEVSGKRMTDSSKPKRMYAKLLFYKATETRPAKIQTQFDDATSWDPVTKKMTRTIDPLKVRSSVEFLPSLCYDTIYFGSKPSIQVKLPRAAILREIGGSTVSADDSGVEDAIATLGLVTGASTEAMSFTASVGKTDGSPQHQHHETQDPAAML